MKKKASAPQQRPKTRVSIDAALAQMKTLHRQGRYQESLDICLQITRRQPKFADAWINATTNSIWLERWQDAVGYAQTALACGGDSVELYDGLAHAHAQLGLWPEAGRYGLQALNLRDRQFGGPPAIPLPEPGPMPPLPSAQTRQHNIIAFSLFGGNSRYCESAIVNVQEQPQIYPHWVCRFYVDDSVPAQVIQRLRAGGAQIVPVEGAAAQWPGPMWRLLALDDRQAHRILFRDADSVISPREAHAVDQWLVSGKRFHMMRDWGSNTALILAGMWGVVAGSLPPLEQLMARFMSEPLQSRHFADQDFLRQYVWPYARLSLMQHDSVFGFMDAVPFPDGARPASAVGQGASSFTQKMDLPDGTEVTWGVFRLDKQADGDGQPRKTLVCAYPAIVKDKTIMGHIPRRYAQWIKQGTACLGFRAAGLQAAQR